MGRKTTRESLSGEITRRRSGKEPGGAPSKTLRTHARLRTPQAARPPLRAAVGVARPHARPRAAPLGPDRPRRSSPSPSSSPFLIYLGWDGGQAGDGLVDGLRDLVGAVHYLMPGRAAGRRRGARPAPGAAGRAPVPRRPPRACSSAAASGSRPGTLGLGAGPRTTGGLVGERLHDLTSTLLGDVGSHIVAVFLFVAGVLLLTGASVAACSRRPATR